MIPRLLLASLRHRFRQLALIVAAVTVAAATVAALAGFALSAHSGLGGELAAFGPNLVVRPQVGGPAGLPPAEAERIRALPGVEGAAAVAELTAGTLPAGAPEVARAALAAGLPVLAAGPELVALHPTWRLHGAWPGSGEAPAAGSGGAAAGAVLGAAAAARLAGAVAPGAVSGTLTAGGDEERAVFLALDGVAASRIDVRADAEALTAVAAAIEATVPGAEARPVRRVSESERALVGRLTLILLVAALVSCALALISVGAATTALVEERRTEAGLLLALGWTGRRVAALFAAELLVAALAAGLAGDLLGVVAAGRLAASVLGAASLAGGAGWGLVVAPAAAVAVVGLAMTLALRRVEHTDAARVLRGE